MNERLYQKLLAEAEMVLREILQSLPQRVAFRGEPGFPRVWSVR